MCIHMPALFVSLWQHTSCCKLSKPCSCISSSSFGCLYLIFAITCAVFPAVVAVCFAGKGQWSLKAIYFSILGGRFCCLYINMMACSVLASWGKKIRMKKMLHFMTQWLMLCMLHCGHLTITREALLCPQKIHIFNVNESEPFFHGWVTQLWSQRG